MGPLTVTKRVLNTTYQIQDDDKHTIVKTLHQNHLVKCYPNEETLPPMIGECVPMDRRHDDFFEGLTDQRFQKLINSEQPGMESSLPFTIELLRAAPPTLPKNRVSKFSSDCGVSFPHSLSPAMPVTPDTPQPFLLSSTSHGPISPIEQFILSNRKSKNKEPINNHFNPITLIRSLYFELSLDKSKNFETSIFV